MFRGQIPLPGFVVFSVCASSVRIYFNLHRAGGCEEVTQVRSEQYSTHEDGLYIEVWISSLSLYFLKLITFNLLVCPRHHKAFPRLRHASIQVLSHH